MPISGYIKPRPERRPPPTPVFDQDTLRERRRHWLPVTLDDNFHLDAEVAAICGPLAQRIAAQPNATGYIGYVETVAGAVGELCATVAGLTADAKLRGLIGVDRNRARDALRTVCRSSVPTITADMLTDESWVTPLVELARRDTDPLAQLLGHQATDRRGGETASDTLLTVLRDLDRAALDTRRRIDKAEYWRAQRTTSSTTPRRDDAQSAQDTLRELGIDTDSGTTT
ncbi:hypothetical protein K8O93_03360 [Gordonia bronchialis]|uniref:hypothetical protein n=1 Tax=Gordonia bronchialis TaxID=2054 RepID=UPI001CBBE9BF|nr:hypothetical protein [Gordonia bronchialis]UAK38816.1 hypothetical protein K8O93_03360 [Gordonia bronchialis]